MPTIMSHALAAFAGGKLFGINGRWILLAGMLSAMLPDADVLGFNMGISYGSMWGHRGFTHSIPFAFIWAALLTLLFTKSSGIHWSKIFLFLFLATASHGLLDAMTTGGKGVAFFAPFSAERYFLPFKVIKVSPLGIRNFFSEWGLRVLKSEAFWIGIPSIIAIIGVTIWKRK